jgi:hypothetical protein
MGRVRTTTAGKPCRGPQTRPAGGTVGVVVASDQHTRFLVTVVLGAKGWAVAGIACSG